MSTIKLAAMSLSAVLFIGCASNSDVRAVKMEAMDATAEVKSTADQALEEARAAKQLAQDANNRSLRSEEMLNRGFKRSMYK